MRQSHCSSTSCSTVGGERRGKAPSLSAVYPRPRLRALQSGRLRRCGCAKEAEAMTYCVARSAEAVTQSVARSMCFAHHLRSSDGSSNLVLQPGSIPHGIFSATFKGPVAQREVANASERRSCAEATTTPWHNKCLCLALRQSGMQQADSRRHSMAPLLPESFPCHAVLLATPEAPFRGGRVRALPPRGGDDALVASRAAACFVLSFASCWRAEVCSDA